MLLPNANLLQYCKSKENSSYNIYTENARLLRKLGKGLYLKYPGPKPNPFVNQEDSNILVVYQEINEIASYFVVIIIVVVVDARRIAERKFSRRRQSLSFWIFQKSIVGRKNE
jgi:hypothetical protein